MSRQWISDLRGTAQALRERYWNVRQHAEAAATKVAVERSAAGVALATVYLPRLDAEAVARAARLTGFKGFERRDPLQARDRERKVLEAALAQIRAEPRYVDRARLVGDGGELTQALADAETAMAPYQQACDPFEQVDGFMRLIETSYDTTKFAVPWYHAEYWKLWATGDRVCRELGLDDFGDDVLPRYLKVAGPRNEMREVVVRLRADVDGVHDLVRRHDETSARLASLDAIYLVDAQVFLSDHLALADLGLLAQWAAGDPDAAAIDSALRRVAGVRAKGEFLAELDRDGTPPIVDRLDRRIARYDRRLARLDRGRALDPRDLEDDLPQRAPGLFAEADKLDRRIDQLVDARDYGALPWDADSARWWIALVKAPPPRAFPGVRDYYDRHPELGKALGTDTAAEMPADLPPDQAAAFMASRRDAESSGAYMS